MSRHRRLVAGTAAALLISLAGGAAALLLSGPTPPQPVALRPVPSRPPAPEPATRDRTDAATPSATSDLFSGLSTPGISSAGTGAAAPVVSSGAPPGAAVVLPPAPQLPVFQFPSPPAFPSAPTIDWQAALQPYIQSQMDAAAANLAGSITGAANGALSSAGINTADVERFADYLNSNNPALLAELQNAVSAVAELPPGAPLPDFSGLSTAFAAAAAQPPMGVPGPPPQLPPPPDLPTPEQVAAALAIPAVGIPALAVPALPPPPPIGLPAIGWPTFELPSITRLLGLPF